MKYRLATDRYQKTGTYKNVVTFTATANLSEGLNPLCFPM
jgi:hypothetical protein